MLFAEVEAGSGWIAAVSAIAGAVGGTLLKPLYEFIIKKKQLDSSVEIGNSNRLEKRVKTLEDRETEKDKDHQKQIQKLLDDWTKQEQEAELRERECQKRVQQLLTELGEVRGEVLTLRRIVERVEGSQHIGIVVADVNGHITAWNTAATFLLEWDQKEVLGQPLSILVPPRMRTAHNKAFLHAIKEGELSGSKRDTYALTRRGVEIPVTISITSFEDGEKKFFTAEIKKIIR